MASSENLQGPGRGGADGEALSSVMEPVRGLLQVGRRFYAAPRGQARVRRATDVIALAASLLVLVGIVAAQPPKPLEVALLALRARLPRLADAGLGVPDRAARALDGDRAGRAAVLAPAEDHRRGAARRRARGGAGDGVQPRT